jgi:hypothetical protein
MCERCVKIERIRRRREKGRCESQEEEQPLYMGDDQGNNGADSVQLELTPHLPEPDHV